MNQLSKIATAVSLALVTLSTSAATFEMRKVVRTLVVSGTASAQTPSVPPVVVPTVVKPLTLSKTQAQFGTLYVGQSSDVVTLDVTNDNTTAVVFQNISISSGSANFGQSNNCGSGLAASAHCTISLSMTPRQSGPLTGQLSVVGGNNESTAALSGTGIAATRVLALTQAPEPYSVPADATGYYNWWNEIIVANTGSEAVKFTNVALVTGTMFQADGSDCLSRTSLSPGDSCSVWVGFYPLSVGHFTDTVRITSNAQAGATQFNVQGDGTAVEELDVLYGPTVPVPYPDLAVRETRNVTVTFEQIGNVAVVMGTAVAKPGRTGDTATIVTDGCSKKTMPAAAYSQCSVVVAVKSQVTGPFTTTVALPYGSGKTITATITSTIVP